MHVENAGTERIIHLTGKVDIDFVQQYKEDCLAACDGTIRLVLDFSKAEHMDSSGLGFVVTLRKTMEGKGGALVLRTVPQSVRQLLSLTRLTNSFEIQ